MTGIKRPHLNWRAPASYVDLYPIGSVSAPKQLTLDRSIDPVAWSAFPMNAPLVPNVTAVDQFGMISSSALSPDSAASGYSQTCGEFLHDMGGGKNQARCPAYPDGAHVSTIDECCALCAPGNKINCTAWIYVKSNNHSGANCWPMLFTHGTRPNPGHFIGGTILPGPPPPTPHPQRGKDFVTSPFVHGTDMQLRLLRQHYYATVSWADYAAGQVLAELDKLGLTESTMVVLHSDVRASCTKISLLSWLIRTMLLLILCSMGGILESTPSGKNERSKPSAVEEIATLFYLENLVWI
eukprot:SAG31_NODE_2826_length_5035_cov_2.062601_6_plen_296_part_00